MNIYKYIGLPPEKERKDLRGPTSKTFMVEGNSKKRTIIFGSDLHFYSPPGFGNDKAKGEWEDIDSDIYYKDGIYTSGDNKFITSFTDKLSGYMRVRPYISEDDYIEFTADKIWFNGNEIEIPDKFSSIHISNNKLIQITEDKYEFDEETELTNTHCRNFVKINSPIYDFKYREIINPVGFEITNEFVSANGIVEYIPTKRNEFWFRYKNYRKYSLSIPNPLMLNNKNEFNRDFRHRLFYSGGKYIYEKELRQSGKDWLLQFEPPYYIDGTLFYSHHPDGWWTITYEEATPTLAWKGGRNARIAGEATSGLSSGDGMEATLRTLAKTYECVMYRSFLWFDTSGLRDYDTVEACALHIFGGGNVLGASPGFMTSGCIQECEDFRIIEPADMEYTSGTAKPLLMDVADMVTYDSTTNADNIFEFNQVGLDHIKKGEGTPLLCREYNFDYLYVEPNAAAGNHWCSMKYNEAGAGTGAPYLDLTIAIDSTRTDDVAYRPAWDGNEVYIQSYADGDEKRCQTMPA